MNGTIFKITDLISLYPTRYSHGAVVQYGTGSAILNRMEAGMADLTPGDTYDWSQVGPEVTSTTLYYAVRANTAISKDSFCQKKINKMQKESNEGCSKFKVRIIMNT